MNKDSGLLDWDTVMPIESRSTPHRPGEMPPENRGYPRLPNATSVIPGIERIRQDKASRELSPESPVSPVETRGTEEKASAAGVGVGESDCARKSTFAALGDLRTCELCQRLLKSGRCGAAIHGEIVASRSYEPIRNMPKRCEAYAPPGDDPDQRSGIERWPGLAW